MSEPEASHPGHEDAPDQTQRLVLPVTGEPPIRTQKLSIPTGTAGQTQMPRPAVRPSGTGRWKLTLAFGAAILLGGGAYLLFTRGPAARPSVAPVSAPETVAPGAQTYLEQAKAGDAHAMRMLGVMYYYGLNVPQDRGKGLYWYRQAAGMGSEAARQELERLEGKP